MKQNKQTAEIDESDLIEFRPKMVFFLTKYAGIILLLIALLVLCKYVKTPMIRLSSSLISILLFVYLFWQYVSMLICTTWTITKDKIIIKKGVLLKRINETELFRIIDFSEKKNIIQHLFNNTSLIIYSSDKTDSVLTLYGIENNKEKIEEIKKRVKAERISQNIRETNINNLSI